ncbi:MAG TPA: hypothetical protein VH436_18370 [Vicinamibacterales bacterium]
MIYAAWFLPDPWRGGSPLERWGATATLLLGSALLVQHAAKVCRVRLNNDGLTISSYWRETHITFAAIAEVELRPVKGPPRVSLTFRYPTPLGHHVISYPYACSIDAPENDNRRA